METAENQHALSPAEIQHTLASIEIPACPVLVTQVMAEFQKESPDQAVATRLIAADVGMSAFTLKLANSPLFRRGEATNSVAQAIARLGSRNIVCVVVAAALRTSMSSDLSPEFLERFWTQAGNVATAAGIIARKLRGISSDSAYTYALFHDAAIPVMMRRFPDYAELMEYASKNELDLPPLESERYRCTHAIVGGLLAKNWLLPQNIVMAIRHHHDVEAFDPKLNIVSDEVRALIAIVHVAEKLSSEVLGGAAMEVGKLYDLATEYLGLHEDDQQDLRDDLADALL